MTQPEKNSTTWVSPGKKINIKIQLHGGHRTGPVLCPRWSGILILFFFPRETHVVLKIISTHPNARYVNKHYMSLCSSRTRARKIALMKNTSTAEAANFFEGAIVLEIIIVARTYLFAGSIRTLRTVHDKYLQLTPPRSH
jgi:hypothetical protein